MKEVPEGAQNFCEWLVEGLYRFLEAIIGPHLITRTFWFFASIFIFILAANWFGLIPGVGTIGWGHQSDHGFVVDRPLLRGATADLNMTLAMALVFFALWFYWVMREVGPAGLVKELFAAPQGKMPRLLTMLLVPIFFAAGCVEVISILLRPAAASTVIDFQFEPGPEAVMGNLLTHYLNVYMYQVLLDAKASEHSARFVSMKAATENADGLIKDLTLQYNRLRQENITNEMLDIAGGQA